MTSSRDSLDPLVAILEKFGSEVLVSEASIRLSEVRRLIRYIEGRNSNYGRNPAYDPLLLHLRERISKLKAKETQL